MKTIHYSRLALKRVLLNKRWPDGNIEYLLRNTGFDWTTTGDSLTWELRVELPEDHWAFTHQEEPLEPRFYVRDTDVIWDRKADVRVAIFDHRPHAIRYADMLNDREAKS